MFILINELDNSYNSHQEVPFTELQKTGCIQIYVENEADLPEGDLRYMEFDPVTETFSIDPDMKILTQEEIAEQTQLSLEYQAKLEQTKEAELLNSILDKIKPILTEEQVELIGNFNTTSDEDVAAIEEALNATN